MKKLKLSLDEITVDSFDPSGEPASRAGTVHGQSEDTDPVVYDTVEMCDEDGRYRPATQWRSCLTATCARTCDVSCYGTCDISCGGTCKVLYLFCL